MTIIIIHGLQGIQFNWKLSPDEAAIEDSGAVSQKSSTKSIADIVKKSRLSVFYSE